MSGSLIVRKDFQNVIYTPASRSRARLVRYSFSRLDAPQIPSFHGRDVHLRGRLAARRVRANLSWRRALELAADSREATPWHGARW
jgi:hypothetical protein